MKKGDFVIYDFCSLLTRAGLGGIKIQIAYGNVRVEKDNDFAG